MEKTKILEIRQSGNGRTITNRLFGRFTVHLSAKHILKKRFCLATLGVGFAVAISKGE